MTATTWITVKRPDVNGRRLITRGAEVLGFCEGHVDQGGLIARRVDGSEAGTHYTVESLRKAFREAADA